MRRIIERIGSTEAFIGCLCLGLILIFLASAAHAQNSVRDATETYFRSFLVFWRVEEPGLSIPYLPGGYAVGAALLVNLAAAWATGLPRLALEEPTVLAIQTGLALLVIAEYASSFGRDASVLSLKQGEPADFATSERRAELAIVDRAQPDADIVHAIPHRLLATRKTLEIPTLPFTVSIDAFMENAAIFSRREQTPSDSHLATRGIGRDLYALKLPEPKTDGESRQTAALVTLFDEEDVLGSWLVSTAMPIQRVESDGRVFTIQLRPQRRHLPFSATLDEFRYETYPMSDIAKTLEAQVSLELKDTEQTASAVIAPNRPLRLRDGDFSLHLPPSDGEAPKPELLVVEPAGRLLFLAGSFLLLAGLLAHFGRGFATRLASKPPASASSPAP